MTDQTTTPHDADYDAVLISLREGLAAGYYELVVTRSGDLVARLTDAGRARVPTTGGDPS